MIMFDRFTVKCDDCGSSCTIGVSDVFDGDAVVVAECDSCGEIERIQTEIKEVE